MKITLNSVEYAVLNNQHDVPIFTEDLVDPFVTAFTVTGRPDLTAAKGVTFLNFPNFMLGFGRDRIDSDSAFKINEYRRFFDSTCDTRRGRDIRLPILEEDSTHTGLEVLRASASFKGNLWGLWDDTGSTEAVARKYTGSTTTWEGGGSPGTGTVIVGQDIIAHKTHLVMALIQDDDHQTYRSTDGVTWNSATTQPTQNLLANSITTNEDFDGVLFASTGNELHLVLWDEDSGTITFFTSTDAGDTWTDEAVDIMSGNGPQGVAVYPDIDGRDKLYIGTREGLWVVDTSVGTWTVDLIFPLLPHNDNFRRMTVHSDGALWFAQGVDDDSPAPIYRMIVEGDRRIFEDSLGLDVGDGVPSDLLGPVRWMKSVQRQLFISVGGGKASRNARVLSWNGEGWHTMRKHGTANEKIEWVDFSADDDGTPRLHYAIRTSSSVSNAKFLGQPVVNPNSGVSIKREASGFIDLPFLDAGFPLDTGPWIQVGIHAENLSATNSNEYINVDYGNDDGSGGLQARTANDLGDFLSGTTTIDFASGAGVNSVNMGLRINLHRDATINTDTPQLKDVQIAVMKEIPERERFEFIIDVAATVDLLSANPSIGGRTPENIISAFKTARARGLLRAFTYGPVTTTKYVRVRKARWSVLPSVRGTTSAAIQELAQTQRDGYLDVVLEEVI
jgi:hypothetical protein